MRGRRVISLLLSLVMALSLCSGVWATAEGGGQQENITSTYMIGEDSTVLVIDGVQDLDRGNVELTVNWNENWGDVQKIGLTAGVLDLLKGINKNVFVANWCGIQLFLSHDTIVSMAGSITGDNKLWIVTDYRGGEGGDENTPDKAVAFRTKLYTGVTPTNLTAYTLPDGQNYTFGMDFKKSNSTYVLYCPNSNNTGLVKQNGVTVTEMEYNDSDMMRVSFSVDCDGDFVLAPSDYTIEREWPWGGSEGGSQFAGMKAALDEGNTAARNYVDQYLVDSTGHVKFGDGELDIRNEENAYNAAEVAAIKAAVVAFRGMDWQVRDPLGGVQGVQIEGDWTDCFGHYLAELASRVGISLWSDDVQDGVEAAVGNYTVTLYTNGDYGVFSLDTAAKVSVDNDKYTMSWDYEQIFFKVACSDENESRPALSYNNDTVQSIYHEGDRMEDGKKVYIYRVQLKRSNQEREVEFTIGNGESAPKFTVKFVDPNPWNPNDAFEAANAPAYVQELYKLGYRTPAYSTNFHLELPWQLHGTDNPSADGHWDYKWNFDEATGIITIEVNSDHEDCWKNCVGTDAVLPDGVYFHYWIGGSNNMDKPMKYGAHNGIDFTPDNLPDGVDLDNTILTADYENNNGWQLATVNQRSTTSTVMTFKEGTICRIETIAMSDVDAKKGEPMNSAETKYVIQINVVTDKTKAVKLETEESQNVPKDRIAFNTVGSVPAVEWKNTTVPEDGKVFALYSGANGDYTKAAAATGDFNGKPFSNMIGLVSIKVPDGCTTLNYVVDDHSENYISSYNYEYAPINLKATGLTSVRFPVFKTHYNSIKLVWSNDVTGKTLTESLLVEMGNATPWMGLLGEDGVTSTPAETIMNGQTEDFLQENGITVTYDKNLGYFSTRVDASKLKDLSALNYVAEITPMEGAAYFRMDGFGGSESPSVHGKDRANSSTAFFNDERNDAIPVSALINGDFTIYAQLLQTDSIKINVGNDELTVYFAANQLFRGSVIQWLDENENVLGYTYVYGRNGDFVTSVPTETKAEVSEAVDAPTLEWNGQGDPGFTCDRNPQTGGNGSKIFFQFSVKHTNGIDAQHKAVIYLPYDYFGITAAEGMRRAARGERPVIYHYLDESCANEPEVIYGEYTPYGVKFETGSFSPFVVDCSTTSTPHRYHSTAAAKADSPETFDGGIALYGALAVTSLTGMAYVTKKRED